MSSSVAAWVPRLHRMPLTYATVAPGALSPRRPVPASIPRPEYVDRPAPAPLHRAGGQGRRDDRADARRGPDRGRTRWPRRRPSSPPASRPTRSTGSATSTSSTTAPTRRRWATRASRSRCARRSTRWCATASPTAAPSRTATSSTSTSPRFVDGVHGDTDATYLVGDVDEESRLLVERTHEAMMRGIRAAVPGPRGQRHRPGHRVVRTPVRLRRRARLHRPRHRLGVPQRPGHPPLRRRARPTAPSSRPA